MKRSGEISPKQEKLVALLLTERTIEGACLKSGVAVTTYWRWMQDKTFISHYRNARRGILENTVARLQGITFHAIDTLERNLNCENPSVETRTAAFIIEQAIKGLEILEIENRVEMLEALMDSRKDEK